MKFEAYLINERRKMESFRLRETKEFLSLDELREKCDISDNFMEILKVIKCEMLTIATKPLRTKYNILYRIHTEMCWRSWSNKCWWEFTPIRIDCVSNVTGNGRENGANRKTLENRLQVWQMPWNMVGHFVNFVLLWNEVGYFSCYLLLKCFGYGGKFHEN